MLGICLGPDSSPKLMDGAAIKGIPRQLVCSYQSKSYVYTRLEGVYQPAFHNSCLCNEIRSLQRRHLVDRFIKFDEEYFKANCKLPIVGTPVKMQMSEFVEAYTGGKKRMYQRARLTIKRGLKVKQWAYVSMFVKPDRYPLAVIEDKAPRAIQYRRPEFNILLGCYLKPLEHMVYDNMVSPIGLRMIAKGLDNVARAQNIVEAASWFANPCFILLDHSKFDSCVNVTHLKMLHKYYMKHYGDSFLRWLLSCQIVNKGFSKSGLRYKVRGTRMSGDYDTGLGNTLLNLAIISSFCGERKHHILLDGDDSVVILEKRELITLDYTHFQKMGFDTTKEIVYELGDVEFCRAKLLPTEPPRFARDWRRAMSNMLLSYKRFEPDAVPRYLAGRGMGELACSNGVPVLGVLGRKLAELSDKPIIDEDIRHKYGNATTMLSITDEVRVAYQLAWGCSIAMQLELEKLTPGMVDSNSATWINCLPHE